MEEKERYCSMLNIIMKIQKSMITINYDIVL